MLILGHRGKPKNAPENSLGSIRRCVEDPNVNGVEFDVRLTKDGVLIVIHDDELSRTTNGTGCVTQKYWDEVQRYRCRFNEQITEESIPELHQVLDLCKERRDFLVDLEIKMDSEADDVQISKIVSAVADVLKNYQPKQLFVSSFNHNVCMKLKEQEPSIQTGFLQKEILTPSAIQKYVQEHNFSWCCLHYSGVSKEIVEAAEDVGARILSWTVDDTVEWDRLNEIGVHAICTNCVDECTLHFADAD